MTHMGIGPKNGNVGYDTVKSVGPQEEKQELDLEESLLHSQFQK